MKFTFASLMLLFVHAVIGVPLAAQGLHCSRLAEVEPAFAGQTADRAMDTGVSAARLLPALQAVLSAPAQTASAAAASILTAAQAFAYNPPRHWGSGDRHALDEGKP